MSWNEGERTGPSELSFCPNYLKAHKTLPLLRYMNFLPLIPSKLSPEMEGLDQEEEFEGHNRVN